MIGVPGAGGAGGLLEEVESPKEREDEMAWDAPLAKGLEAGSVGE